MPDPRHHPARHQPGDSDDAHDSTVLPFPHPPEQPVPPATQKGRWQVERIDTEPMTAPQYDRAVSTLATLITQWQTNQENANEPHQQAA